MINGLGNQLSKEGTYSGNIANYLNAESLKVDAHGRCQEI